MTQGVPASFGQPNWVGLGGWLMVVWVGGPYVTISHLYGFHLKPLVTMVFFLKPK